MTIFFQQPMTDHGTRVYAIGDIHGQIHALKRILNWIEQDLSARPKSDFKIILLGDLVDRGDDSRGTIDLAMKLATSEQIIILRGNHEEMLLGALDKPDDMMDWRKYGGLETLSSFGIDTFELMRGRGIASVHRQFVEKFGSERRHFIETRPYSFECGSYFFCHAGIRPGIPLPEQSPSDLAWIREPFLFSDANHDKIIVHGHTPVEQIEIKPNRINIDTGAYMTGRLTCLILEEDTGYVFDAQNQPITRIF